jgi:hypothetical protein
VPILLRTSKFLAGAQHGYCLAKHNSLIINTKILPDKYPLCASSAFTAQMLPINISQLRLTDFLVKSFSKNLTKNTWIIFWWIKI